jgi:glycerol-3-phosphate acyltransferase PlsX
MRIAVDAMGGDRGPDVVVRGALEAGEVLKGDHTIALVGDEPRIRSALSAANTGKTGRLPISIVHTSEAIEMAESAVDSFRRKRNSSIAVALRLLKEEGCQAFVSAGNTGAIATASLLNLGRIPGVLRPAIATIVPTPTGHCVLLDAGANSDCRPVHLFQFAIMGRTYAEHVFGVRDPTVGLLNIGEESSKGNDLCLEAFKLLDAARDRLHFVDRCRGLRWFHWKRHSQIRRERDGASRPQHPPRDAEEHLIPAGSLPAEARLFPPQGASQL